MDATLRESQADFGRQKTLSISSIYVFVFFNKCTPIMDIIIPV